MNGSLGTVLKFLFHCEKRMATWAQLENFAFCCKKTNSRLDKRIAITDKKIKITIKRKKLKVET